MGAIVDFETTTYTADGLQACRCLETRSSRLDLVACPRNAPGIALNAPIAANFRACGGLGHRPNLPLLITSDHWFLFESTFRHTSVAPPPLCIRAGNLHAGAYQAVRTIPPDQVSGHDRDAPFSILKWYDGSFSHRYTYLSLHLSHYQPLSTRSPAFLLYYTLSA